MINSEAKRFIEMWRKLPPDKQSSFYFMLLGAVFASKHKK